MLFLILFFLASPLLAATPYVGGSTGFAFFSGAFGRVYDGYRLGGEVAYQKNEIDNLGSAVSVFSVIANGHFDYRLEQRKITPFLSAALSYAQVSVDAPGDLGSDVVLTVQLGAGVGVSDFMACYHRRKVPLLRRCGSDNRTWFPYA
ncbi:MAG: hypothetical protein K9G39_10565 [Chlorobium sp.]|uniref:hypothetical protein n=1 Tax=Chlorobium sp. TaxID=1095 RepID=UPI0025C02764|nr:hypothetical protein [Chlorobium sp.]MCF8384010.1 hypothetical protein [Chlorobium sp.]